MSFEVGRALNTNEPFCLNIESVVTGRTFIACITRHGKSWTARKIIEDCFGSAGIIILDPEGEYASLREKYGFIIIGKDIPIQLETAEFIAEQILQTKTSVIIDLSMVEDDELGKEYVNRFLRRFFFLETQLKQPYLIVVEESEDFAPEKGIATETCLHALVNIVKKGGKRGIGAVFLAHRPAWVSKGVLSQCSNKAVGKVESTDFDALRKYARVPVEDIEKLPSLNPGEFCLAGDWVKQATFVKVGKVQTTHLGCYLPEVQVLTPEGPKEYSASKVGDNVWSLNLQTGFMEAKPIEKIYEGYYEGPVYRIKGKRVNNVITPNHRVLMKTAHIPSFRYEKASSTLKRYEFHVATTAKWKGTPHAVNELMPECSEERSCKLPEFEVGDLLELTGWYIAEGFTAKSSQCVTRTLIQICSPLNDRNRPHLESLLKKMQIQHNLRSDSIRIQSRKLCAYFERFGRSAHEKHIPEDVLDLPSSNLERLFNGLINGDGWNHNSGAVKGLPYGYSTASKALAFNVFELALKLGFQPRIKPRKGRLSVGKTLQIQSGKSWEVYFVRHAAGHVRKEKISSEPYKGKVWCYDVADNSNMLVLNSGTAMFCGNSTPKVIPPSPAELRGVIASLQKALPEIIEKIKPTVVPIEKMKEELRTELEDKYKARINAIQRTANEKAERKFKVEMDNLKAVNDKLSRSQALQPTAPISDVLEHPIVKTRMSELPDKTRDLLTKIEREPNLTRQQLAAFLTTSTDSIGTLINTINRVFRAEVIVGDGKPIKYRSMLKRLFLTDVAKREIQELQRLQNINQEQASKLSEKGLENSQLRSTIIVLRDEAANLGPLRIALDKANSKLTNLTAENQRLIEEKKEIMLAGKAGEALATVVETIVDRRLAGNPGGPSIDIQKVHDFISNEVETKVKEEIAKIPVGTISTPVLFTDEKAQGTAISLEQKVTHFDLQKNEEHLKVDLNNLQGRIIFLITKGFWETQHKRQDVVEELSNNGWNHDGKEVDSVLIELCQKGVFYRKVGSGRYLWYTLQPEAKGLIHA